MLGQHDAVATIAVTDLERAKAFYRDILGLSEERSEMPEAVASFRSGGSAVLLYRSEFAGSNRATAITWTVQDLEAEVERLGGRGVRFEHYDFPGGERRGDVHVFGSVRNAWFKDPDGNILSIVSVS
ncbi:MAG: VOC family protein [Caulobacteraceae bacterium]|nr:VOC family protein [Caulobacteraceae bacterium]